MENHEISEFVNSADVRAYLQNTGYEFSTPQAAWLVYQCCRLTMSDRHRAWLEIIRDMPDCAVEERLNLKRIDSFHAFLSNFIELEDRSVQEFMTGTDCTYCYEYHEPGEKSLFQDDGWYEAGDFFSNYQACIDHCRQYYSGEDGIDKIRIHKHKLDPSGNPRAETLILNQRLEVLGIDMDYKADSDLETARAFGGMCFDIPVPFRRGDILVDCKESGTPNCTPFVLSYISTWDSKKMLSSGFRRDDCPDCRDWEHFDKTTERLLKTGDDTDSHAIGTIIAGGNLFRDNILITPTDLAYFTGSLEGVERQLQIFSQYEKGEADGEALANCCFAIRVKEYAEDVCQQCVLPYAEEFVERIGLIASSSATSQTPPA